jgi:glycosyltransferase involved in cell wall biosynthesis
MTGPLVSVIVPTYNRAYCLARTLGSVLSQSYPNFEIVLLDDGSTDGTEALIAERYRDEPRVRYHKQKNTGVSGARNAAFALARGELVALLDSDDEWLPWKLEAQVGCMERAPGIGMTWTDMEAIDLDGNVVEKAYLRTMYDAYRWFARETLFGQSTQIKSIVPQVEQSVGDRTFNTGEIFSQMVMGNLVHTSTVILRKERLARVGGFREDLRYSGEDYDFHLRTCREGPVGYLDVSAIRYQRGHPDRLTRPEYAVHVAANFLKTLESVLARDRDKIKLPPWMIDAVQAEAHEWLAGCLLDGGDLAGARRHFLRSLRFRPFEPRIAALLALSSLPKPAMSRARSAFQRMKKLLQPGGR